jgi:hypothetical protein
MVLARYRSKLAQLAALGPCVIPIAHLMVDDALTLTEPGNLFYGVFH